MPNRAAGTPQTGIAALFSNTRQSRPNQARTRTADSVVDPPPPSGAPVAAATGADTGPAAAAASAAAAVTSAPPPTAEATEPTSSPLNLGALASDRRPNDGPSPGATASGETPSAPTAAPPTTVERGPEPIRPPTSAIAFQLDTTDSTPTATGPGPMPPPVTTQPAPGGDHNGNVGASLQDYNSSAYAREVAAEAATRSAAAANQRQLDDLRFTEDARRAADELQQQEQRDGGSSSALEGLDRPPSAAAPADPAAPAPTAAAADTTLDTVRPAPLRDRAYRRPDAAAAPAAATQSGTGARLNLWIETCFELVAPQHQTHDSFPFLSPEALESVLNCSIRAIVRAGTTYKDMLPELIELLHGTPAALGSKFHRAQMTNWGNAFTDAAMLTAQEAAQASSPPPGTRGHAHTRTRHGHRAYRPPDHHGESNHGSPSNSVGYTEAVASNKEVTPGHLARLMDNPLYQRMEGTVANKHVEEMALLLQPPHPHEDEGRTREDYYELLPVLLHYMRIGKKGMTPTGASEDLKRFHGFVAAFQGTMSQLAHGIVAPALPHESAFKSWEGFSGSAAGSKAFTAGSLPDILTGAPKFSPAVDHIHEDIELVDMSTDDRRQVLTVIMNAYVTLFPAFAGGSAAQIVAALMRDEVNLESLSNGCLAFDTEGAGCIWETILLPALVHFTKSIQTFWAATEMNADTWPDTLLSTLQSESLASARGTAVAYQKFQETINCLRRLQQRSEATRKLTRHEMLQADVSSHPVMLALDSREKRALKRNRKATGLNSKTGAGSAKTLKRRGKRIQAKARQATKAAAEKAASQKRLAASTAASVKGGRATKRAKTAAKPAAKPAPQTSDEESSSSSDSSDADSDTESDSSDSSAAAPAQPIKTYAMLSEFQRMLHKKQLPRQCMFRLVTGKAFPIKGGCAGKATSSGGRLCAACEADKKRQTAVGAVDVSAASDKATKIWLTDRSGRYVPALELLFSAEGKGQTIRKTLL